MTLRNGAACGSLPEFLFSFYFCIYIYIYICVCIRMFYLTTHSTHFIYGYMVSDMVKYQIVREETRCHHMGYSFRLTARAFLYAPSQRQDCTYHSLCYTSRGALARTRNRSMGSPHEGSIRRHIAPSVKALTTELHLASIYI